MRARLAANAGWLLLVLAGASVLAGIGALAHSYFRTREVVVTVTDKGTKCSGSGSSISCAYLIYTSGGVFADTDSVVSGKYDSSDLYGQIKTGHTYRFSVHGWRIPFDSEYPDIMSIERSW